jgi:hypothetical protein
MKRRGWLLIPAILAFAALVHAGSAPFSVPFVLERGAIVVQGEVDGAGTQSFILDTGAGPAIVFDLGWAKKHGYASGEEGDLGALVGGQAKISVSSKRVKSAHLGPVEAKDVQPLLFDMEFLRERTGLNIAGILGQYFVDDYLLTIDYVNEKLTFTPQEGRAKLDADQRRQGAAVLSFRASMDKKMMLKGRVGDGEEGTYILDTGAMKSTLFGPAIEAIGSQMDKWPRLDGLRASSMFGDEECSAVRVPRFSVGTASVENEVFGVSAGALGKSLRIAAGGEVSGLVGYTFLKHFIVTIDYGTNTLYLLPHPNFKDKYPNENNGVGISLLDKGGAKSVYNIPKRTPAEEAGIRVDDELVSIDGVPAEKMTLSECLSALEGEVGTTVKVILRRDGAETEYTLTRRKLL